MGNEQPTSVEEQRREMFTALIQEANSLLDQCGDDVIEMGTEDGTKVRHLHYLQDGHYTSFRTLERDNGSSLYLQYDLDSILISDGHKPYLDGDFAQSFTGKPVTHVYAELDDLSPVDGTNLFQFLSQTMHERFGNESEE